MILGAIKGGMLYSRRNVERSIDFMYWTAFLIIAIFIITPIYLLYQYSQTGLGVFLAIAIGILIFLPGFIKNVKR